MSQAVAARYAHALVQLVEDARSGLTREAAESQLAAFSALLAESKELREALITPAVSPSRKRAAASRLADAVGLHRLLKNFLFVLIDHRRIPLFDAIREAFQARLDELQGLVRAEVAAAAALGEGQRKALTARLEAMTGKKVVSSYTVDPALLGGVTVRMGSTFYDGSVRGHLQTMRRNLGAH